MPKAEKRDIRPIVAQGFELRAAAEGDAGQTVVGYAAVFDQETDIGGYFREKVAKGAFSEAIGQSDIHALYNHDYGKVLGRHSAGTLRMKEDGTGLFVEIDLPDTQDGRDLAVQIERGDIDQMSFQFSMRGGVETWDESGDDPLRIIEKVGELYDVSVCPRGAYPTTECGLRSLESHRDHATRQANFHAATKRRMRMNLRLRGAEDG